MNYLGHVGAKRVICQIHIYITNNQDTRLPNVKLGINGIDLVVIQYNDNTFIYLSAQFTHRCTVCIKMSMSKAQTADNTEQKLGFHFITFCQENDVEKVNYCIKLGVNVNTVSEDGVLSGLTIASMENFPELLELLLSQPDIDVNLTTLEDFSGETGMDLTQSPKHTTYFKSYYL